MDMRLNICLHEVGSLLNAKKKEMWNILSDALIEQRENTVMCYLVMHQINCGLWI
jgi:hypothetical protein